MTSIEKVAKFVAAKDSRGAPKATGQWHNLQIRPDLGSAELFNVGVAFVDESQNVHLKLARDLSRLTCLYDDRIDVGSFERLCALIENAYDGSPLQTFNLTALSPQASLSGGRYAAGSSVNEILNSFFQATVPLGLPKLDLGDTPTVSRAQHLSTTLVQKRVIAQLIVRMGARAAPYIARAPWVVTEEGRERKISVPIRAPGKLCASVVSVWTKDRYRRKYHLAEAGLDLDVVQHYAPEEKLGLFVMRPNEAQNYSTSELDQIDDEIDEAAWRLRKLASVKIETGGDANDLSGKLAAWIEAA
ncbi:MAG: hypothetical protein EOP20_00120 [Hyphomicrobiales bacterium]|nr:MAG: hypothetical protein EOP20_00120 [Hyphomicrobiales bacterium]